MRKRIERDADTLILSHSGCGLLAIPDTDPVFIGHLK